MDINNLGSITPECGSVQLLKKLFEKYGRDVYLRILNETENREIAKKLTVQVFSDLQQKMQQHGSVDSLELLLNEFTDTRIKHIKYSCIDNREIAHLFEENKPEKEEAAPVNEKIKAECTKREHKDRASKNEKKKGLCGGAIAGIIIVALIGIWFGIGFLLKADILTGFDLGYEWFNQTIANIF